MELYEYKYLPANGVNKDDLVSAAGAAQIFVDAKEFLEHSMRRLIDSAQPFIGDERERAFRIVSVYQNVLTVGCRYHHDEPRSVIREVVRRFVTGEVNIRSALWCHIEPEDERFLHFSDLFCFLKTLQEFKHMASEKLWDVVEGKGDDAYGDFIDSLILAGKDVCDKVTQGYYKEGDADLLKDDIKEATPELAEFIIYGENYIEMYSREALGEFMHSWVKREIEQQKDN